jgi:hypothetical protein
MAFISIQFHIASTLFIVPLCVRNSLTSKPNLFLCKPTRCTIFSTWLRFHVSTCFGPICSPSSGGWVYYVANGTCFPCNSPSAALDKKFPSYPGPPTVNLQVKQVPFATLYTVSWWWATHGPETCKDVDTQQSEKISSCWFIIQIYIQMHCQPNITLKPNTCTYNRQIMSCTGYALIHV